MDVKIAVALVGGCAATLAPAISYYFTKKQERSVTRHNLKFSYYQEFIDAAAGFVGNKNSENRQRLGRSINTMYLVASNEVIGILHAFLHENRESNPQKNAEEHDRLLSWLVWEIRKDLKDPPTSKPEDFKMRLWS